MRKLQGLEYCSEFLDIIGSPIKQQGKQIISGLRNQKFVQEGGLAPIAHPDYASVC